MVQGVTGVTPPRKGCLMGTMETLSRTQARQGGQREEELGNELCLINDQDAQIPHRYVILL